MQQVLHSVLIQVTDSIENSNVGCLLSTLIIFWVVGERCIKEAPRLEKTGQGIGVIAFVLYLAWSYRRGGVPVDGDLFNVSFRALLCAGYATPIAWVLLTLGEVVYRQTIGCALRLLSRRNR